MALTLQYDCQDDAASATVVDGSGNANHGAFSLDNSDVYSITGPGGTLTKAFDGSAMAGAGDLINTTSPITIASNGAGCWQFWLRFNDPYADGAVVCNPGGESAAFFNSSTEFKLYDEDDAALTIAVSQDSDWHHYAIVFKTNSACDLYIDASLIGTMTGTRSANFVVAGMGQNANAITTGEFSGIRGYDTVRTQPEIAADYALGVGGGGGGNGPRFLNLQRQYRT